MNKPNRTIDGMLRTEALECISNNGHVKLSIKTSTCEGILTSLLYCEQDDIQFTFTDVASYSNVCKVIECHKKRVVSYWRTFLQFNSFFLCAILPQSAAIVNSIIILTKSTLCSSLDIEILFCVLYIWFIKPNFIKISWHICGWC